MPSGSLGNIREPTHRSKASESILEKGNDSPGKFKKFMPKKEEKRMRRKKIRKMKVRRRRKKRKKRKIKQKRNKIEKNYFQ